MVAADAVDSASPIPVQSMIRIKASSAPLDLIQLSTELPLSQYDGGAESRGSLCKLDPACASPQLFSATTPLGDTR
jgi:hypothetical protein